MKEACSQERLRRGSLKVTEELGQSQGVTSTDTEFRRATFLTWVPWQVKKRGPGHVWEMVFFETQEAGLPWNSSLLVSPWTSWGGRNGSVPRELSWGLIYTRIGLCSPHRSPLALIAATGIVTVLRHTLFTPVLQVMKLKPRELGNSLGVMLIESGRVGI